MPRPSLKLERRAQILQAFGRCLARYGLEGATLERVADEADLARALIRHNVGNRAALIDAFVEDFLAQSRAATNAMIAALPDQGRAACLVDWLFDPDFIDAEAASIGGALLAAADEHPGLRQAMSTWNEDFVEALAREFEIIADGDAKSARVVAVGVAALYANVEAIRPVDPSGQVRRESLAAARRLAATLPGFD